MNEINGHAQSFINGVLEEAKKVDNNAFAPSQEDIALIESVRLDLTKDIQDPTPLILLDGSPVCTRGNFSFVVGLPGSRKTFLCTGIVGCYLSEGGYFGMENATGVGKLLWVDTEQAQGHVARIGKRLNRIVGIPTDQNADNVTMLMLREFQPKERRRIFDIAINYLTPDFVVLDGLADLITDPNSSEQSTEISSYLLSITKKLNCHILTVIHANVGSEKARGHLGADALRKCETAIIVNADGENSICKFAKTRDIRPGDFAFVVNEGLPETTSISETSAKDKRLSSLFSSIIPPPNSMSYTDMVNKIMEIGGVKKDQAKKRISNAVEVNVIEKNESGYYSLKRNESVDNNLPF